MRAGQPAIEALTGGYRWALLIGAGLVVAAVMVAVTALRPAPAGSPAGAAPVQPRCSTKVRLVDAPARLKPTAQP